MYKATTSRRTVALVALAVVGITTTGSAQLLCEDDPTRTVFAGAENRECETGDATLSGRAPCGPVSGCGQFDGDQTACEMAFGFERGGPVVSCWYETESDRCLRCDSEEQSDLNCVNTCDPPECPSDPDRTYAGGGNSRRAQLNGVPQPSPSGCEQFDENQTACEAAFTLEQEAFVVPVSCEYDSDSGDCEACGRFAESECSNACLPPPTCLDDSLSFAGGPGDRACRDFSNRESCEAHFARNGNGRDVSCFWDDDNFAQTSGIRLGECRGCTLHNEADGRCTNHCAELPGCGEDPTRELVGGPGSEGCRRLANDAEACESAYVIGSSGVATACVTQPRCEPCGGDRREIAVGAVTQGLFIPSGCLNDCVEPPECLDDSLDFVGGPGTQACRQFDDNQAACEMSYALSGNFGPVSCWYDEEDGDCRGCIPEDDGDDCTNVCQLPPPCAEDPSRTDFVGGAHSEACRVYDGNETSCDAAYARRSNGEVVSCFYDDSEDECVDCGPSNQTDLGCSNSCLPPPSCERDAGRTDFVGGPNSRACRVHDGDETACNAAFARRHDGEIVSCFYTDGDCLGCGPQNQSDAGCTNSCAPLPSCELNPSRTDFVGGPNTGACHTYDNDETACELAFARSGQDEIVSCWYEDDSDLCRGCSARRRADGDCLNECSLPDLCQRDSTRTVFVGDDDGCAEIGSNEALCNSSFASIDYEDSEEFAYSCYFDAEDARCRGCDPDAQNRGQCNNTCAPPPFCMDSNRTDLSDCFSITDLEQCGNSFSVGYDGMPTSCFVRDRCLGCGLTNQAEGLCQNSCFEAVEMDDDDDVPADTEDGGPNDGDGNDDGVLDSVQPDVTTLPRPDGGYVTMITAGGCMQNMMVRTVSADDLPADPDFAFPFGLVEFKLNCDTADITMIFHGSSDTADLAYRKYGPLPPTFATPQWYTLEDVVFASTTIAGEPAITASFTLVDGERGDDTPVDGMIVDQGGPGSPTDTPVVVVPAAAPAVSWWGLLLGLALLSLLALRRLDIGRA